MTEKHKNALYIAKRCQQAGMTLAGCAGAIVNFEQESAINPINVEDRYHTSAAKTDEAYTRLVDTDPSYDFANDNGLHFGYGLAQWTDPSRKVKMRKFHTSRNVSIGDFKTQVEFFIYECRSDYPGTWSLLCSSKSAYDCAYNFCKIYENPANAEAQATYRAGQAQAWYDWLKENQGEAVPDPEPEKDDEGIPIPTTWPPRTIDKNCAGWPETWLLQAILKCRGYNVLVNGQWPESLTEALKTAQQAMGLTADGCAGPKTWAKLFER